MRAVYRLYPSVTPVAPVKQCTCIQRSLASPVKQATYADRKAELFFAILINAT